ncbi:MAG TPA: type II toxin-antitoxin system VapC family toxin [Anaerolineales bacterium]|nr:type II toxin-antitoxin system VapC family toxin [Anaerolineales bacterium]
MAENKPVFVLDSFAVLAYFQAEDGGERVLELLNNAREDKVELMMSLINAGEVVYLTARNRGHKTAESLLKDLRNLPITLFEASEERILASAWIKANHAISYADSFAVQLAQELRATLVTGDPEFEVVKDLQVLWLVE